MRCNQFLIMLLLVLLLARGVGAQAAEPVDLEAYRQAVERALELVDEHEAGRAADALEGISAVRLPSGETTPVDHSALVRALRAPDADLAAMANRLQELRYELDHWPSGTVAPDAFDKLANVLASPEFQYADMPQLSLPDWLFKLIDALRIPALVLAVALLAGAVGYVAFSLWGSMARRAEAGEESAGSAPMTAAQALARSRELAHAGDYRTAIRLLYLSTLLLLEERNLLRYDRTLTNREYLRQVQDRAALAGALRPVVETFDEVWYGVVEPDAERYEAYVEQVEELREVPE